MVAGAVGSMGVEQDLVVSKDLVVLKSCQSTSQPVSQSAKVRQLRSRSE